jgi:hypothetical protein
MSRLSHWSIVVCAVGSLALAAACSEDEFLPKQEPVPASFHAEKGLKQAGGPVSAPFDVSAVIRQVHFAYREDGAGFTGGHSTYGVRVNQRGAFEVTPYHHLMSERELDRRKSSNSPGVVLKDMNLPRVVQGTPATFETNSISRVGIEIGHKEATIEVTKKGSLAVNRGMLVEYLRNSENGVEQSWQFREAPNGSGDLVIRIQVSGVKYAGMTENGLHFVDAMTGIGVRYGNATWVDAQGEKTPIKSRFESGEIVLTIPDETVIGSVYPAVLDPTISPEFGMDNPVYCPALGMQRESAVGFDGTNYFVVWVNPSFDLLSGTRVSPSGNVLDPWGIIISSDIGTAGNEPPGLAFDGSNYLIAWTTGNDIKGARVDSDGNVLDASGISISTVDNQQRYPSVAFGGNYFLAVWEDERNGGDPEVYGSRISSDGIVQDPIGITISTQPSSWSRPSVASDGTNFLVAWIDGADIHGTRVGNTGEVLDPSGISICGASDNQYDPSVVFGGTNYLVVWTDTRPAGIGKEIYGARVGTDGSVIDIGGIHISAGVDVLEEREPAAAYDGTNFLVVWEARISVDNYDIIATRLDSDGTVLDPTGIVVSSAINNQSYPSVAGGTAGFFVAWDDYRDGGGGGLKVYGARTTSAGSVLDTTGILVSSGTNNQDAPSIGTDGTNYLVVWSDYRNPITTSRDIYGVRVDSSGNVLDPAGIGIGIANSGQDSPAVAFDGTNFFVVWEDQRNFSGTFADIYGARVGTDGVVLDSSGIGVSTVAEHQRYPSVAFDGSNYLVVWEDNRNASKDIYGARVGQDGIVLDSLGIPICTEGEDQHYQSVAFEGTSYLVVWQDRRDPADPDIYGARVNTDGTVLDTTGFGISTAEGSQGSPSVSTDGTNYLVVWYDNRSGSQPDIYGARVAQSGNVLDPSGLPISVDGEYQRYPSITFDGWNYLVLWEDRRNNATSGYDIFGTRVSPAGDIVEPSGFAISTKVTDELAPVVAANGAGRLLVAYYRYDPEIPYVRERVRARFVSWLQNGDLCTTERDCQTTLCVDGVCCDVDCGGGDTTDCIACSTTAGAQTDGVCGPVNDGRSCSDGDLCTQTDTCLSGSCAGSNPVTCTAIEQCHEIGTCEPATGLCTNPNKPNGTACNDGNDCSTLDTCQSGFCTSGATNKDTDGDTYLDSACPGGNDCNDGNGNVNPGVTEGPYGDPTCSDTLDNDCDTLTDTSDTGCMECTTPADCNDGNVCTNDQCVSGDCQNTPVADGSGCNDGDACTQTDTCQSGACTGADLVICTALDQCHDAGVCDSGTGNCSNPNKTDGAACDDGLYCNQGETCQAGNCSGGSARDCSAWSDQCNVGACDEEGDTCYSDPAPMAGQACNDGLYCNVGETCQAGSCAGGSARGCGDGDSCTQDACDEANDNCTHLLVPNPGAEGPVGNATCGDSVDNDCDTLTDGNDPDCQNCTLDSECEDGNVCTINTCSGGLCQTSNLADGSACDDGFYCTVPDSCTGGVCGGVLRDCSSLTDQCNLGVCNDTSDACQAQVTNEGGACNDGNLCTQTDTCQSGSCIGSSPVVCTPLDQCHDAGTCDPAVGLCSNPAKADGTVCSDGNFCTQSDSCLSGTCLGSDPIVCSALSQCHDAGICNPATGVCSNPAKANGTACDDGNACTQTDTCMSGVCTGSGVVQCTAQDECHDVGVCDPVTGCSNPEKPYGTPCTNGTCQSGVCVPEGTDGGVDGGADAGQDGGQDAGADEGEDKPGETGCGCQSGTVPTGFELVMLMSGIIFFVRRRFARN